MYVTEQAINELMDDVDDVGKKEIANEKEFTARLNNGAYHCDKDHDEEENIRLYEGSTTSSHYNCALL